MEFFDPSDWLHSNKALAVYESIRAMGTKCDLCNLPGTFGLELTWRKPNLICKLCALDQVSPE